MKISIVNAHIPFVRGGAEYLADGLSAQLRLRGHKVEHLKIPFKWYPTQQIAEHMLACRLIDSRLGNPDLMIALKFPCYLVPFSNMKTWLCHQFRQVYELWGTPLACMPDTPETRGLREMIHHSDNVRLRQIRDVFTISGTVADRLKRFNGIEHARVLYYPLDHQELFGPGDFSDYFFMPSRMNAMKRQHVLIEAMRHVRSPFRLLLAGRADEDSYDRQLRQAIEKWGLQDKVVLLGWVSDEEKARLMSNAYAAIYAPFEEDAYGYVTLEAFHCHKPLLTFRDSGGTIELVDHGQNGLVLEPTAEALAEGMEALWADRPGTRAMGKAANEKLVRLNISWDHIVDHLLAA
jgi:glycosyltransferase involved in cell wall biosynthesis